MAFRMPVRVLLVASMLMLVVLPPSVRSSVPVPTTASGPLNAPDASFWALASADTSTA
jgi:hypothetical protein